MAYEAKVYNVMIASPCDVENERRIAREVLHYWNSLHSATTKIVLMPISWETHSSPEMGDRPQAIINKQVLQKADLLIGIFWTRLGTPTGTTQSGTVEEIYEHIKADKPAMIYFSKQPVMLDSVDQDQYQKLKTFINECRTRVLLFEYETFSQFKENLYCHLVQKVNGNKYFTTTREINNTAIEEYLPDLATPKITLSKEAQELLVEASQSPDGRIMKTRTSGGLTIQTNKKNFVGERNPRLEAVWEDAVKQLDEMDLIEDKGYKGEVFAVTRLGYEYADKLKIERTA